MENLLIWLQNVYADDFCNGSWEHEHGVTIDTLDPGWDFKFELINTDIDDIEFTKIDIKKDDKDWYQCWIKDGVFHGWGGAKNLVDIIREFKKWYLKAAQIADQRIITKK